MYGGFPSKHEQKNPLPFLGLQSMWSSELMANKNKKWIKMKFTHLGMTHDG